jgi:hypothetical protein
MKVASVSGSRAIRGGVWILTLLLAAWAYWPGLNGPMVLDDHENLKTLERIEQEPDFWVDIVWANASGPSGRPLTMLGFALEKRFLDRGVFGQKRIGLLLHLLNGCLVFVLLLYIYRAAGEPHSWPVAQLSASLWLMSPLLLSTTLYVVQRMALQSATFGLAALILYCVARQRQMLGQISAPWFGLAMFSSALAFFSKENGLLVLPMMAALELFVFRFRAASAGAAIILRSTYGVAITVAVVALMAVLILRPELLFAAYAERDFTLWQRLLTQSRILWTYLLQFFWPSVQELGVYHDDILISSGLTQPLSTLPAVVGWVTVVAGIAASLVYGRLRMLALGLSLYLIGHAMESTVLPLELYFEHRNYLASVGLVLALGWAVSQLYQRYGVARNWIVLALLALLLRQTLLLGSQAVIWSDSALLHLDVANGHPNSPRATYELAQLIAQRGALPEALALVERANDMGRVDEFRRPFIRSIYYCRAGEPLPDAYWEGLTVNQSLVSGRQFSGQFSYLIKLVIKRQCSSIDANALAADMHRLFFRANQITATPRMLESLIFLENYLEHYPQALEYALVLHKRAPESVVSLQFQLYLSTVLELPGQRAQAAKELLAMRQAGKLTRQEIFNLELFLQE